MTGWIVDLRSNTGGDFQPMVAGLGPILGEGVAGYFVDADKRSIDFDYVGGRMTINGFTQVTVQSPYSFARPNPPVALLFDNLTSSSGEATAIAFVGRSQTRSFGVATCGLATSNEEFTLSDGAILHLTTANDADRLMRQYPAGIPPDQTVTDPALVVPAAVTWLSGVAGASLVRR